MHHTMIRDCRSTIGKNARFIKFELYLGKLTNRKVENIDDLLFQPIPSGEEWRITMIKDLLEAQADVSSNIMWKRDEIIDVLTHVCVS